jgi:uncharacterized protein involved in type VI secretion and phage assembly
MTLTLFETIQKIVQEELRQIRTAEIAVVQERHPHAEDSDKDNYACTVELRNSGIVLKQVPVATSRIGTTCLPEVGNTVLVQFIGGDINAPVITGCLYNDEERPPVNEDGQSVVHLPLDAEDSDAVHVELKSGDTRGVIVKLGKGMELNVQDDDPVVELKVDDGKATITIARDGTVSLETDGDIDIKGGTITVEAQSELNLKGGTVNIN